MKRGKKEISQGPWTPHCCSVCDDQTANVTTMTWDPEGQIVVVGHPENIISVHEKYETALPEFIDAIRRIAKGEQLNPATKVNNSQWMKMGMDILHKSIAMAITTNRERMQGFLRKNVLAVQFCRIGRNAYSINNIETFKFLSSLEGIESVVNGMFLATPSRLPDMLQDRDERYTDPKILEMLNQSG